MNGKICVLGCRGMVGSAIINKLRETGYANVVAFDIDTVDLRRQNQTEAFFESERPDYVFLAAAKVGGIYANSIYKAEFIYDNIAIAANTIESAHKSGVKKLLNLGSSCIYPKLAPQPMKEEYLLTGSLEPTNEPYAIAKIAAIKLCRYYNEQYGTDFISVMPTNLYGAGDNFNLETSHVLPALIRKTILAKAIADGNTELVEKDIASTPLGFGIGKGHKFKDIDTCFNALRKIGIEKEKMKIWGSGLVRREFLYVDDLADACIYLMEKYSFNQIGEYVNIGCGVDVSIIELAVIIKDIVGFDGELSFDPSQPEGTPRKLLDVTRLTGLGWKATIPLEEGIARVVRSYYQRLE